MTPQLYDRNEEHFAGRKLHLGCGGVYLRGYVNCDMHGNHADGEPEHATDITDYYRGLQGSSLKLPERRECVVDEHCDLRHIDRFTQVCKIVAIQCLEHLPPEGVEEALQNWYASTVPGGIVIVSVPDTEKTLRMLSERDRTDFAVRHLVGKRDDYWYYHRSHWTRDTLHAAFWRAGFRQTWEIENIHFYPAIVLKARK